MFRKLIMHIASEDMPEEEGAAKRKNFAYYCNYLKSDGVVGKPLYPVLDRVREAGNAENHEIRQATEEEGNDLLGLVSVLIKTMYFVN